MHPEFSAVLLAGGRSSRMGRDKALLPHPVSGLPLIVHQANTLREAGCVELFLAVREGADYPQIGAEIARLFDDGEGGPLPVIERALGVVRRPQMFLLAVDMPFVTPALVRALLARSSPDCGVVGRHDGGFEPLCAVYAKSTWRWFEAARIARGYALQPLLADAVKNGWMREVAINEPTAFANWNAPQDVMPGPVDNRAGKG